MGRKSNKKLGIIVGSIGLGIVVTIIVPIWGWLFSSWIWTYIYRMVDN